MFWLGLRAGVSISFSIALFVAGLALWTLMEYVIHRFSFHFTPHGRFGATLAYLIHGVHHAYPEDHRRWVTPPVLSLPIALALYFVFSFAFGRYINSLGAGVAIGYMLYDLTHYLVHRGRVNSRIVKFLRSYHMQHHYSSPERRYGVSSPLWDYVFRTHR
jgi:sterol desaturase/sphingolipid hydroxylase (fatty acid hydroxylase superfamily)